MIRLSQSLKNLRFASSARACRRFLRYGIVAICLFVLFHAVVLAPFQIPTGSMAPTLRGRHRVCTCPRCSHDVVVGRSAADVEGSGQPRYYRKVCCPNCGLFPVPVANTREVEGNRILVNKSAFVFRSPTRWEIVVFRLLGTFYIKRLLGLPGEEILIHEGDLYVDGQLVRKSFEQARAMRMLVFDQDHAPQPEGWKCRWQEDNPVSPGSLQPGMLIVDGRRAPNSLTYCNFSLDSGKCEPLRDEYSYNAGLHPNSECVHDFMIETEVEVSEENALTANGASKNKDAFAPLRSNLAAKTRGKIPSVGTLSLRLCDGGDWVDVRLPVGEPRCVEGFSRSIRDMEDMKKLVSSEKIIELQAGRRYRIEMAFVDRRLSLALDGRVIYCTDLPAVSQREGVQRPFQVQADGVQATLQRFRLHRDLHYGQQGDNAVHGKSVRLGIDQYFVLGDNSPNSLDSRFWPDQGRVASRCLTGPVWLTLGSSPLRWFP